MSRPQLATVGGQAWVPVAELPRPLAESYRRALAAAGVPSLVRTPFQWVHASPVIEIETGGYQGVVGVYVPRALHELALAVVERLEGGPAGDRSPLDVSPDDAATDDEDRTGG